MPDSENPTGTQTISVTVNGRLFRRAVPPRMTLADFLRDELGLTGTHLGCEHGVCGACSVFVEDRSARACLTLAVQVDGLAVRTVEGLDEFERPLGCGPASAPTADCSAGSAPGVSGQLGRTSARHRRRETVDGRFGARGAVRQHLSVHRLPRHRAGGAGRGNTTGRVNQAASTRWSHYRPTELLRPVGQSRWGWRWLSVSLSGRPWCCRRGADMPSGVRPSASVSS